MSHPPSSTRGQMPSLVAASPQHPQLPSPQAQPKQQQQQKQPQQHQHPQQRPQPLYLPGLSSVPAATAPAAASVESTAPLPPSLPASPVANSRKRKSPGMAQPTPAGPASGAADAMLPDASIPPSTEPKPKKSRTNTPWTPAEEQRLKRMRDAGNSWSEIAKTFPQRTEGSVKKHWYKDMHYAEFGEDESTALLAAIKEYEANKWKAIGLKVGKPAKACEQYAKENFQGKY